MRFSVTYLQADGTRRVRFFKTLVEAKDFISNTKTIYSDFKINVHKF